MQLLRTADPTAIAGFRLLGRLGAGGMGVVYLARSGGGALAALKLIRAEHAADPGFRARFRREARIAEQIRGRWVVRVIGADPDAREPWLATEFVPGPSLAEAVGLYGALPEEAVRALGARLAEALAALHEAGLVHRDVKPGNVLLALDGPRLIDFGIARAAGATALTATDAVIGSPGYLSPEQARAAGAGEVGPPSDVFSLGCVLAHAATGRRPFGTGTVAAIVYRTVHEEADLDGVPRPLLGLVRACLAKDPAARPTAHEVRASLGAVPGRPEGPAGDWLPPAVSALIAQRSARVLDLPVSEPTLIVDPDDPGAGGRAPSRRRLLVLGSAAAVVAAGGVTAWLVNRTPAGAGPGGGGGPRSTYAIGVQTDLSGPGRADGTAQERGARLAVETFNSRQDRPFDLALKVRDDGGDPGRALAAARAFAGDRTVLAVLGPVTARTVVATAAEYHKNLLVLMNLVAGVSQIDIDGQTDGPTYFELRPGHDMLTVPLVYYLTKKKIRRTAIVEDRAGGTYSWRIAKTMKTAPPSEGTITSHPVAADTEDFAPAVRAALAAAPGAVVYAGDSPRRAALCAKALRAQGFTGLCGSVEYVLGPEFTAVAGPAAEGWLFGTTYTDPAVLAPARQFTAAYRTRWRLPATAGIERFALEAYDAVLYAAEGMRLLTADGLVADRGALRRRLRTMTYQGLAKTIAFHGTNSMLFQHEPALFMHRIQRGAPRFLGQYKAAAEKK
ncbi:bifunctional serine/threonine-protein kinase/ABC transporter substrate-binding protein [Streptomyces purpureus]|uniref:bifunctional serine/threonine-protein kinase/ABC transporter substrate-binding protein n=1 Tax=Streptomyces purpureus TaxID=1951 RepID=UPI000363808F|nr:bifunctional serine/threonine-protein kinase/ABC transporter substrate-binding protein [Streptomyces purpureus]